MTTEQRANAGEEQRRDDPCECKSRPFVSDSRVRSGTRRRNYVCMTCGARWATVELPLPSRLHSSRVKLAVAENIITTSYKPL
jgi:hypothetical protein